MKLRPSILKTFTLPCAVGACLLLSACGGNSHETHEAMHESEITSAVAVLHPTEGNTAAGTVYFTSTDDGKVRVVAELTGLTSNTFHGFHIHQYGDCTAPDGTSAGGHYSPEGHDHGAPGLGDHHAGDLGNVESDAMGNARKEMIVDFITIDGSQNPILGRGVILHADEDDLVSQPTGAAGPRIACGVIGVANPKTSP